MILRLKKYIELEDEIKRKVDQFREAKIVFTAEAVERYILEPLRELNNAEKAKIRKYNINKHDD